MLPNGSRMKCFRCGSIEHLIEFCTGNTKSVNQVDEVDTDDAGKHFSHNAIDENEVYYTHSTPWYSVDKIIGAHCSEESVVLFTGNLDAENCLLNREASTCAVIDSACTSNVCGSSWMKSYLSCLSERDKESVVSKPSNRMFKFGGESLYKSVGMCTFPARLVNKDIRIQCDVVESEVPLLLSRKTLKKMKAIINFENDSACILGERVNLSITSSGHHCVNILPETVPNDVYAVVLHNLDDSSLFKALKKIHCQFGHPPRRERLVTLLKDAGVWEDRYMEVLNRIYSECEICHVFARTPARPVVALSLAREFNQVVAMDLKYWKKGLWILHLVDVFSRYTMSDFITRKKPEDVINVIMSCWIAVFGVMKSIMSDNGGEFSSEETRDVASVLNWEVCTTGAESPFQNGLCERNHAVCDNILTKLQAQYPKTPLSILLKWANMAKNTLAMWNGFSSNQIVFGKNPNLPNIMSDKLPALEGVTESKSLAMHLNALHAAREQFVMSETDEKIRRALRHNVRTSEELFNKGDKVYYKKEGQERWLGPATVVCQDGKVIFARHGGQLVRLSPGRITRGNFKTDQGGSGKLHNDDVVEKSDKDLAEEIVVEQREETPIIPENQEMERPNAEHADDPEPARRSLRLFNQETGCKVYMVTIPKSQQDNEECRSAKYVELDKLATFDVYDTVPDSGQKVISTRWILWKKGNETRARLVARGFEEYVYSDVDSPTVGKSMVRLILSMAASFKWNVKTTDIKSAFLQGLPLEREVYLIPPPEAKVDKGYIWKLKKCLYGLSDAARRFYDSVVQELVKCGCEKSSFDPSFFMFRDVHGNLIGVIAAHIDDFLHAGTAEFEVRVIQKLCIRFLAGKQKDSHFKYVGYQITQLSSGILMDQNQYVENIEVRNLSAERESQKNDLLSTSEMTGYRAMVGSLNWVVQGTRPDLAFMMTELSTKFRNAKISDYLTVKKVLVKAKTAKCEVFFPYLGSPKDWIIAVCADASHGNLNGGVDSSMGYVVFIVNPQHHSSPSSWRSGKVKRVVRSTIAAETLAMIEGLEDGIYLQHSMKELLGVEIPIVGYTDNQGQELALKSTKLTDDRRLRIDIAGIKEMLKNGLVREIRICSTGDQLADCLTKKTADNRKLLHCLQNGVFDLEF